MTTFVQPFTLTATSTPANPTRPTAIPGTWSVRFFDDFTTTSSIAPNGSATTGYNWYWQTIGSTANYSVNTTATPATINNGNSGGGPNASTGILTVKGGTSAANNGLVTQAPGNQTNSTSTGAWQNGYYEAYIQYNATTGSSSNGGWPAFWSWTSTPASTTVSTEIDFLEVITSTTAYGLTVHNWLHADASGGENLTRLTGWSHAITSADNNWHTYGTWINGGHITAYIDNVQVAQVSTTSTNLNTTVGQGQFLILGTGQGWNMNVDWVRAYTA